MLLKLLGAIFMEKKEEELNPFTKEVKGVICSISKKRCRCAGTEWFYVCNEEVEENEIVSVLGIIRNVDRWTVRVEKIKK